MFYDFSIFSVRPTFFPFVLRLPQSPNDDLHLRLEEKLAVLVVPQRRQPLADRRTAVHPAVQVAPCRFRRTVGKIQTSQLRLAVDTQTEFPVVVLIPFHADTSFLLPSALPRGSTRSKQSPPIASFSPEPGRKCTHTLPIIDSRKSASRFTPSLFTPT